LKRSSCNGSLTQQSTNNRDKWIGDDFDGNGQQGPIVRDNDGVIKVAAASWLKWLTAGLTTTAMTTQWEGGSDID
jgi:hypothetical protein